MMFSLPLVFREYNIEQPFYNDEANNDDQVKDKCLTFWRMFLWKDCPLMVKGLMIK